MIEFEYWAYVGAAHAGSVDTSVDPEYLLVHLMLTFDANLDALSRKLNRAGIETLGFHPQAILARVTPVQVEDLREWLEIERVVLVQ